MEIGDRQIILKTGQKLGFSKNELIKEISKKDANINLGISKDLNQIINDVNNMKNEKRENKIKLINETNNLIDQINDLEDEISKGNKIKEKFEISKLEEIGIVDQINLINSQIERHFEAVNLVNFEDISKFKLKLEEFSEHVESLKNRFLDLEDQMKIQEKKVLELKSIYDITCSGIDPNILIRIGMANLQIKEYHQKANEIEQEILPLKVELVDLKSKEEILITENSDIKNEIKGHENFLIFYLNGEFENEINRCIERKNAISEYLIAKESEMNKILKLKKGPLSSIDQTREECLRIINKKQSDLKQLINLNKFTEEKIENEIKAQEQIRKDIEIYNKNKEKYVDILMEYHSKNIKKISEGRSKVHELNTKVLECLDQKKNLADKKFEKETSFKAKASVTVTLAVLVIGMATVFMRFL